jgi:DNA-binding MarR family transcriptional regulator
VLSLLARNEGINQGGLADILEVEPITLGRMIDRLQDADLVERRADPADRRAWRLHLTPKGTELILQLQPYARLTIDQALDGINDAESRRLMDTLLRMRSNLSRRPGLEEPRQP